jgi:hypothetical protein
MLTPELQKIIEMYAEVMKEISARLRITASLSSTEITTGYRVIDYETMAMSFRKIAELIILANLIGHETEYSAAYNDLNTVWNMGQLINKIKKINPYYYPMGLSSGADENMFIKDMKPIPAGEWMTEQELIDMWGKCSDLIHGHNPYKAELDYESYDNLFDTWGIKIGKLLSLHSILLTNQKHILLCLLSPLDQPDDPFVTVLEKDDANQRLINLNYKPYKPKQQIPD